MRFDQITGQSEAIAAIRKTIEHDRIPHAFLFHGRSGSGKTTAALALARLLQCRSPVNGSPCEACPSCHKSLNFNHPDIKLIPPTPSSPDTQAGEAQQMDFMSSVMADMKKSPIHRLDESRPLEHRIRTMRWLKQEASRAAVDGPWKIFLLKRAGMMNVESANAILKLLEEPNPGTVLILGMERPTDLPDTIKSRCSLVRFHDLSVEDLTRLLSERLGAEPAAVRLAVRLARGSLTQAAALIEEDVLEVRNEALELAMLEAGDAGHHDRMESLLRGRDKARVELIFDLLLLWYRDLLRCSAGGPDAAEGYANADREADLAVWSRRLDHSDIAESIDKVEDARAALRGHGYLPLVLYSLIEQLPRGAVASRR